MYVTVRGVIKQCTYAPLYKLTLQFIISFRDKDYVQVSFRG
jgi:hypothetical protein